VDPDAGYDDTGDVDRRDIRLQNTDELDDYFDHLDDEEESR
jgi:hypothetical protein